MCGDTDIPPEIMEFSHDPDYVETEVLLTLDNLKKDFQLLFDYSFRIKTFAEALNVYRESIGVEWRTTASSEVLAEKFRDIFDRNTIIERIYSGICTLQVLLDSEGFMKLDEGKRNRLYGEIRSTVDYIQNLIRSRIKVKIL